MNLSRLWLSLFLALVAVGVLRPSLPDALREHWGTWIVILAVATGVADRPAHNRETMTRTLETLTAAAEAA